jgi:hypothetical protein
MGQLQWKIILLNRSKWNQNISVRGCSRPQKTQFSKNSNQKKLSPLPLCLAEVTMADQAGAPAIALPDCAPMHRPHHRFGDMS